MPWSTPFDDPIPLHGGGRLATLQQAADYVMALPEKVQHEAHWQVAVENLINAAETGGGWLMFAHAGAQCGRERQIAPVSIAAALPRRRGQSPARHRCCQTIGR